MTRSRAVLMFAAAIIAVIAVIGSGYHVAAVGESITTSRPVYSLWPTGGLVTVTGSNLNQNTTYYLWLLKPRSSSPANVGSVVTRTNTVASTNITILPGDPAGTYTLSLSSSPSFNTSQALTHFGTFGTDAESYNRTQTIVVAGGGFAENSTIALSIRAGNLSLQGYPLNVRTDGNGQFQHNLRLLPSSPLGAQNVSVSGRTFDLGQTVNAVRSIFVGNTRLNYQTASTVPPSVQRTQPVTILFHIFYPDGSPATTGRMYARVISSQRSIIVPLNLANATTGQWQAIWTPVSNANLTSYHFAVDPSNLTDSYGNSGRGPSITSSEFNVLPAELTLNVTADSSFQRTQQVRVIVAARYPGGGSANVTQGIGTITRSDASRYTTPISSNGTFGVGNSKLMANATLGSWSMFLNVSDKYGNNGTKTFTFQVLRAVPKFLIRSPSTTQRTTSINVTSTITYPDGTPITSGVRLTIATENRTWTPTLALNATTSQWRASYYVVQNATLGRYNITLTVDDAYGNSGLYRTSTQVTPAAFSIVPSATQSTVESFKLLDLAVRISYPNGTSLSVRSGQVNATYTNSTGAIITVPLRYNSTQGRWHLFFFTPEQGNFTFSFKAVDNWRNSGIATDAYHLKVVTPASVIEQKLIIAAVIAAVIPIALLSWAILTISTRRRKHRP